MSSRKHHSPLCERRQLVRGTNRLSSPTQHFRKHTVSARLSEFPTYEICRSFPSCSRGSRHRERSAARPEAKCGPPLPAPSRLPRGPRGPAPRAPPPPGGKEGGPSGPRTGTARAPCWKVAEPGLCLCERRREPVCCAGWGGAGGGERRGGRRGDAGADHGRREAAGGAERWCGASGGGRGGVSPL